VSGPRRNRVAPDSNLIATSARGIFFGNRGRLHDRLGRIAAGDRPRWAGRRWIICLTRYKDWRRPLTPPGGYTGLFFLDEATALAAGHRPCALCRRDAYNEFRARIGAAGLGADALDLRLHEERLDGRRRRRRPIAWRDLPAGAIVESKEGFDLVLEDRLLRWRPDGYGDAHPRPRAGVAMVLTPPTALRALDGLYPLQIHPSAG